MKKILLSFLAITTILFSCAEEDDFPVLEEVIASEASDDDYTVAAGESLIVDLLANDNVVEGSIVYYIDETTTENGKITVNADGTYTILAAEDFVGSDSFTYTICLEGNISEEACTTAEVTINVLETFTLSEDDYEYIASEFRGVEGYESQIASMADFGNFDRVADSDSYWSNDQIEEALNVLIEKKYGDDAEEGQKFAVTYSTYDGEPKLEKVQIIYSPVELVKTAIKYVLTSDDYDLAAMSLSSAYPDQTSNLAQFGNFNRIEGGSSFWTDEMIKEAVQVVLSENTDAQDGDLYEVTYSFYDGNPGTGSVNLEYSKPVTGNEYDLTSDDYDFIASSLSSKYPDQTSNLGQYGNFNRIDGGSSFWTDAMVEEAILIVLNKNYPDANLGDLFSVTYTFYDGNLSSETVEVEYKVSDDVEVTATLYELTSDDYNLIASNLASVYPDPASNLGQYGNFNTSDGGSSSWSADMIEEGIKIALKSNIPNATTGDLYEVTYSYYDGNGGTESVIVAYDEDVVLIDVVEEEADYTLTSDDYDFIATSLSSAYPDQTSNLAQFGNFNRIEGGASFWSDAMIEEAILLVLNENYPNAITGDIFKVDYSFYDGAPGTAIIEIEL